MNYFSVVFVTRVNFAGAYFTRRHVKRAFKSVFLVNLFFTYYDYHICITIKANQTKTFTVTMTTNGTRTNLVKP